MISGITIAIDLSNNIHVVWLDSTPGNYEIYCRKSTNGGVTWGGVKRLTWNSGSSYNPAIAMDSSNNIHVAWNDETPGNWRYITGKGFNKTTLS